MEKLFARGRRSGVWLRCELGRRRWEADLLIECEDADVKADRDAARESCRIDVLNAIVQVRL